MRSQPIYAEVYVNGGQDKFFSAGYEGLTLVNEEFPTIDDAKKAIEETINKLSLFFAEAV